jgi:hypothetical protein
MAQVVELLLCKHKARIQTLVPLKKQNKTKRPMFEEADMFNLI